jgi:hypothetical protein
MWTANVCRHASGRVADFFTAHADVPARGVRQIRANFRALLDTNSGYSHMSAFVHFNDYVRLFLRFGSEAGFVRPLCEVTDFFRPFDDDDDDEDEDEDDDTEITAQFLPGFCLTLDRGDVVQRLMAAFNHTWPVVRPRTPNRFTLLVNNGASEIVATSITYYAVPAAGRRFSVVDGDDVGFTETWRELIADVCKLEIRNGIQWQRPNARH